MSRLQGIVTDVLPDSFHMRLHDGTEVWVRRTHADAAVTLETGGSVEVYGKWSHEMGDGDEMRLFSAREIRKLDGE